MTTWDALLRSPGDLIFLSFVFLSMLLLFGVFFVLLKMYKVLKVRRNGITRRLVEFLNNSEGGNPMKSFFDNGRARVSAGMAQTPLAENEDLLVSIIAGIDKVQDRQALEYLHLNFAARLQAQGEVFAGNTDNYLTMLRTELKGEQSAFNERMLKYLEQNPEVLAALMNKQNATSEPASASEEVAAVVASEATSEPAPASEEVATVVASEATSEPAPASEEVAAVVASEATSEPAPASEEGADQGNVVSFIHSVAEENQVPNEEELKILLSEISWLPVNLPQEPYKIMDLPASTFDRLWGAFNVRLHKTISETRAFSLLDTIKDIRDGDHVKKVG